MLPFLHGFSVLSPRKPFRYPTVPFCLQIHLEVLPVLFEDLQVCPDLTCHFLSLMQPPQSPTA